MVNQSKINDLRFWRKWVDSGAVHSHYEQSSDLIKSMKDPKNRTLDPHWVARELTSLYNSNDQKNVLVLAHVYAKGLTIQNPNESLAEAKSIAKGNLMFAATLADIVHNCGYEASGQLNKISKNKINKGPIAQFYTNTIAYNPKK